MFSLRKKYKLEAGSVRQESLGSTETKPSSSPFKPSRVARMLALAHYVERLVESGILRDFAHAASVLGITRARLSQLMNLQLLAPTLQASILSWELKISERRLRNIIRHADWQQQKAVTRRF